MSWFRRKPKTPALMTPTEALRYEYGEGFADGAETTLRLALGETRPEGGVPYPGRDLPPAFRLWAQNALENIARVRAGEDEPRDPLDPPDTSPFDSEIAR